MPATACNYPLSKHVFVGPKTFDHNSHAFYRNGTIWEFESIKQFQEFLPKRQFTLVDVGAQVGLYTLLATHIPEMTVHAFEPCASARECLQENIDLNRIEDRVHVHPVALSDRKGSAELKVSRENQGLSTLGQPKRFAMADSDIVKVATETIDGIFFEHGVPVDVIKIDTEGWELRVLKGAKKTIQKWHPVIQIEDCEVNRQQCGVKREDIVKFLKALGYSLANKTGEEEIWTWWHHATKKSATPAFFQLGSIQLALLDQMLFPWPVRSAEQQKRTGTVYILPRWCGHGATFVRSDRGTMIEIRHDDLETREWSPLSVNSVTSETEILTTRGAGGEAVEKHVFYRLTDGAVC